MKLTHEGFESIIEVFEETGSNIFHLQPSLVEMFRNSSVDEISVDFLKMPYEMLYLYFGPASRLKVEGRDAFIDGACIWSLRHAEHQTEISITLTHQLDPEKASQLHFLQRFAHDPDFNFTVGAVKGMNVTVREALDHRFSNPYELMGREGFERMNAEWAKSAPAGWVPKNYDELLANWKPDLKYRDPAIRPALNLVINAICYLAYDKREVVERYPDSAPDRLVKQATAGTIQKERKRGRSKLEDIGFRKVFFCGDTIERRMAQAHGEGGGEVSPHWRRGHWRNQAHGTGLSLRKLIWIEPVLVKEGEGDPGGHIYLPKQVKIS